MMMLMMMMLMMMRMMMMVSMMVMVTEMTIIPMYKMSEYDGRKGMMNYTKLGSRE